MLRPATSAAIMLAIAISPLVVLCGPECDASWQSTATVEASCPLHDALPADQHDSCDHAHAVAPATAGKTDQALTAQDAALHESDLGQLSGGQVAPAWPEGGVDSTPTGLLAHRFLPLRI